MNEKEKLLWVAQTCLFLSLLVSIFFSLYFNDSIFWLSFTICTAIANFLCVAANDKEWRKNNNNSYY